MQRTGVRCIWLTKNKKETKMTPNEIATDITGLGSASEGGNINLPSWNSTANGQDFNQWDT